MKKRIFVAGLLVIYLLTAAVGGFIVYVLLDFTKSDTAVKTGILNVKNGSKESFVLSSMNMSDRVYLVFNTSSRIQINVKPPSVLRQLPYDIESLPFDYQNWLLFQQRFLFIAQNSSTPQLSVSSDDPEIPYAVKVLEGTANYSLFNYVDEKSKSFIGINVNASTLQGRFNQVMLLYPFYQIAKSDFRINGSLKLLQGKVGYANLILITSDRNWRAYTLFSNLTVPSQKLDFNIDLFNETASHKTFGEDYGKRLQYIAFTFSLDSLQWPNQTEAYTKIALGEVDVRNENETTSIRPYIFQNYSVNYTVYIFRKFKPDLTYHLSILAFTTLFFTSALASARLTGAKFGFRRLLERFTVDKAESDPEPDTYLAKLSHKPRYDKLVSLLNKFAGREIDVLLDVGCGKGILRKWLLQKGINVGWYIGCDVDPATLRNNRDCDRVVCDVGHLPFRNKTAKVVTCSEVLEHVSYPYSSFKELLRVAQHWVFFTFPDEKIKNAFGLRYPEHISDLNESEFEHLASEKGWKIIATDKIYSAFPPSVFDKIGLNYNSRYRTFIATFFQTLSKTSGRLSLIKTKFLVLEAST